MCSIADGLNRVGTLAPSFFTGSLVKHYGAPRVMQIGFVLLLGHVTITLLGFEFFHFLSALILLGVGSTSSRSSAWSP